MTDPRPIPRRLVLRILADVLHSQLSDLERRTHDSHRRRPHLDAPPVSTDLGRARRLTLLRNARNTLRQQAAEKETRQGPGMDAAVLGYLIALAYGHTEAFAELDSEYQSMGRPQLLQGLTGNLDDFLTVTQRVLANPL